ncbi:MAG: Ger(x)C family spore germination protein [Gorillibacterium sp.]|nr:Ger(x)C family spore germination protein [Gorillibacterium sp.]
MRKKTTQHLNSQAYVSLIERLAPTNANPSLKRLAACCTLLLIPVLLSGCWDRTELNDVAITLASAADAAPDNKIMITTEYPIPAKLGGKEGGGGDKPYVFLQGTGRTVRDVSQHVQKRMARKINMSHRRVFVIGEEMAKRGVRPLFDQLGRFPENRLNGLMVVARGSGSELLHGVTPIDEFSWEGLREIGKGRGRAVNNMKNVTQALNSLTVDTIMVYMGVEEIKDEGGKTSKQIKLLGYAQFKQDKMVGVYTGEQIEGIHWLMGQFIPYEVNVSLLPGQTIVLNLMEGRSTLKPYILPGNKIRFDLDIKAVCSVAENYGELQLDDLMNIRKLSSEVSNSIKQSVESAFSQMQEKKTDSVGFGNRIFRKYPRPWLSRLQNNWNEEFPKVDLRIHVQTTISHTGLTNNNIAKEEKKRG